MPRLPTVARRAATVSDIVTTGMGPSYPRGRPLKRPSRPFLFLTLIPGVRGTRVARRRGPHAMAYVTAPDRTTARKIARTIVERRLRSEERRVGKECYQPCR